MSVNMQALNCESGTQASKSCKEVSDLRCIPPFTPSFSFLLTCHANIFVQKPQVSYPSFCLVCA